MIRDLPKYTLQRSKRRRTIEIQVRPEGVRVLAPVSVSRSRIDQFVTQKSQWISQHQQALQARLPDLKEPQLLDSGSQLKFLGHSYELRILDNEPQTEVKISGRQLLLHLSGRIRKAREEAIPEQLEKWYRDQSQRYLEEKAKLWSKKTGLYPSAVTVRSYRRKWGCCNSRGEIRFNWLLIMAPETIIDYVVIHELCHLQEMNHSPAYWQLVKQYYPHYKGARQWLNDHGLELRWLS